MCVTAAVDLPALDDDALRDLVLELEAEADRLEARRLAVLSEWDARAVWSVDGASYGASWLAARGRTARGTLAGTLRDGRKLRRMPATSAAMAEGRLAPAKARLLARAVNERTEKAFARDEEVLIASLAAVTVDDAALLIRHWQLSVDQDGPKPDDRDENRAWLSQTLNGRFVAKAELDVAEGAVFQQALQDETERIRRERRATGEDLTGKGPQLRAEALMNLIRRSLATPEDSVARRPLVWVLTDEHQLATGLGVAELAGAGPIPARVAQRLACDCDITKVVINADDKTLTLNRAQRRASANQRRLLHLRDGGCAFPGCGRPPNWCEAHHITFWEHGGTTNLDNLCLLCPYHHHLCHEGGFTVAVEDGELVFRRPDGTRVEPPLIAA